MGDRLRPALLWLWRARKVGRCRPGNTLNVILENCLFCNVRSIFASPTLEGRLSALFDFSKRRGPWLDRERVRGLFAHPGNSRAPDASSQSWIRTHSRTFCISAISGVLLRLTTSERIFSVSRVIASFSVAIPKSLSPGSRLFEVCAVSSGTAPFLAVPSSAFLLISFNSGLLTSASLSQ